MATSSPAPHRLSVGSLVAGRFQLERRLGEGGMGTVWAARHVMTKRAVAIKVLKAPANLDLVQRFVREARAANAVKHPHVVQVHDVFELEGGLPAMVMDLFEGESLASQLERSGPLSLAELARIMTPVMSALSAIHAAGIVHRDLKPDNVFMARLGEGRIEPMVLDFGVCKLDDGDDVAVDSGDLGTTAGRIMGTPCYMAPEQVRGVVDVDARADVWALGIILFEAVTGARPFDGDSMDRVISAITSAPVPRLEEVAPGVPAELASLIGRMLVRDRDARLADLAEAQATLQRVAAAHPQPLPLPRVDAQKTRVRRRAALDAVTQARSKLATLAHGAVARNVSAAPRPRAPRLPYFGGVFAAAAALGVLVGVSRGPVESVRAPEAAATLAGASALASPRPEPVAPAVEAPPATPVLSVDELPAEPSKGKGKAKGARPPPKRFDNGVQDFGGRR